LVLLPPQAANDKIMLVNSNDFNFFGKAIG